MGHAASKVEASAPAIVATGDVRTRDDDKRALPAERRGESWRGESQAAAVIKGEAFAVKNRVITA
jgi:hypothetical protein